MPSNLIQYSQWYLQELAKAARALGEQPLQSFMDELMRARQEGKTIYLMGNGGSAATATHMASDLAKTASTREEPGFRAVALNDNISLLTAISNDVSYDQIFARQLQIYSHPGDLVVLISGKGNSENLLQAADYARTHGMKTVGILGFDGGRLKSKVDLLLHIPVDHYGVVEDIHLSLGHLLTFYFRDRKTTMHGL